jgi:hypothetical protein
MPVEMLQLAHDHPRASSSNVLFGGLERLADVLAARNATTARP